jgi:hypothetical protein
MDDDSAEVLARGEQHRPLFVIDDQIDAAMRGQGLRVNGPIRVQIDVMIEELGHGRVSVMGRVPATSC